MNNPEQQGETKPALTADGERLGGRGRGEGVARSQGRGREPGCQATANVAVALGTLREAHWPGSASDHPPEAPASVPAACVSLLVLLQQNATDGLA